MLKLSTNASVIKLARDLGLPTRGDCLTAIEAFALRRVENVIQQSVVPITSLDVLKGVLADSLSVNIQYIRDDDDLNRIADEFKSSFPTLRKQLEQEFGMGHTEGLLLENHLREPYECRYLAIIDSRGDEANRANFTAWHELVHVLIAPGHISHEGVRRGMVGEESRKEPLEQVVDLIAGRVAFYDQLFVPTFTSVVAGRTLSFNVIEDVRLVAAPSASLQSTAMACVRVTEEPLLFVKAEPALRASERRAASTPQLNLGVDGSIPAKPLRVVQCFGNDSGRRSGLQIFKQMRVPEDSVIMCAYANPADAEYAAVEDQAWWEISSKGPLPSLPILVRSVRRGAHVYGLISYIAA